MAPTKHYRFLIRTPGGGSVCLTLGTAWDQPGVAVLEGTPFDKGLLELLIDLEGHTPYGEIARLPRLCPMDVHATLTPARMGYSLAFLEGRSQDYPPKYAPAEVHPLHPLPADTPVEDDEEQYEDF